MTDDRLQGVLGSLRRERMDRIADDKIRARLETAWTTRMERRSFAFRFRRLAPVLAALVLFAGLGASTMTASGESPLYGVRVAIEDAAIALHVDPEDRAEYVVALLEQRQAEAARLEASGNAAAASRARQIEHDTLLVVRAMLPVAPESEPAPAPAPTQTPTPAPTATPTPTPTVASTSTPTLRPTTTTPPTQKPSPTPTPVKTATPTPTPTGSPMPVVLYGNVKNPDLSFADGACVSLALPTSFTDCPSSIRSAGGTYRFTLSARLNQTITLYAWRVDPATGVKYKGTATVIVKSATQQVADIKLARQ